MARLSLALAVFIAVSCSTPERVSSRMFYDIDSLINVQVAFLSKSGSRLEKKAGIGENLERVVNTPDSAGWSKELAVFRQLEVAGRPTNRDKYQVSEREDTRSNLKVRSYVATGTPVPYVHLYYLNGIGDLRKIEAGYYESNLLYTSKRDLTLEFDRGNGTATLKRYSIEGYQKIIMADSVHFSVEAEVIF
jgi:hypothetical protein